MTSEVPSYAASLILLFLTVFLCRWRRQRLHGSASRTTSSPTAREAHDRRGAPVRDFRLYGHEEANPRTSSCRKKISTISRANEEGAALLLVPESAAEKGLDWPREILYLPPRDLARKNGMARAWARTIRYQEKKWALPMSRCFTSCMTLSAASPKISPKLYRIAGGTIARVSRTRRTGPNG